MRKPTTEPVEGRADATAPAQALAVVARTSAVLTLVVTIGAALPELFGASVFDGDPDGWYGMHLGAAVTLAVLAVAVLIGNGTWTRRARLVALAGVLVPVLSVAGNLALRGGLAPIDERGVGGRLWWIATEQTSAVHLLLGLALLATPVRHRVVRGLRSCALTVAFLIPAASVSSSAFGSSAYSLFPTIEPSTGLAAATTLLLTFGVAAVAPDRWPVRSLLQSSSDLVLLKALLPFIVAMPVIGPILVAITRFAGADGELSAVVGTLGPSMVLVGLLAVALSDHRALNAQLESRDRQLRATLDGLPQAVCLHADDGSLLHLNPGGQRLAERLELTTGAAADTRPGSFLEQLEVIGDDGRPLARDELPTTKVRADGANHHATLGFRLAAGDVAWYGVRAAPAPLADGTTGMVISYADVTERQTARHRLAIAQRSLRLTFEHAPVGIATLAIDGSVLEANAALSELLGDPDGTALDGGFWGITSPDDREDDARQLALCLSGRQDRFRAERRLRHAAGHWVFAQLSVALVRDDAGAPLHFIAQVSDLTERRILEQELRLAALQDPLTGLVNRRALADRLTDADRRRARDGGDIGLLYLDLDGFKPINDDHGHEVGDRVLVEVARRLIQATREIDTVCRVGGDEFVVLCAPIDGVPGLTEVATRLERMPAVSVRHQHVTIEVGASIGATLVRPGEGLDVALRRADTAMYRAKRDRAVDAATAPAYPSERPLRHRVG